MDLKSILHFYIFGYLEKKSDEAKETKSNGAIDEHDENSNNASVLSTDGHDNSGGVREEITPKRNAQRTAKVKVTKYDEDDNNDDEEDESMIRGLSIDDEDEESDYMGSDSETEKKIKKATTKPKQPKKMKTGLFD